MNDMHPAYSTPATTPRPTTSTWGWIAIAFGTVVVSVPTDVFIGASADPGCHVP